MNGSIRKEMDRKVTHLVANSLGGEKYKYATTFNIPIMSESWVTSAWENRHVVGYSCKNSEIVSNNYYRIFDFEMLSRTIYDYFFF